MVVLNEEINTVPISSGWSFPKDKRQSNPFIQLYF